MTTMSDKTIEKQVQQIFKAVTKEKRRRTPREDRVKTRKKDKPVIKKKPVSESKDRRRAKQGRSTGPIVTLKEIAFEYEIEAKKLRRLLRNNSIKRPEGRWEWPEDSKELSKIYALIPKK